MGAGTNEKKIRKLETFKRLINLGLIAVCLAFEIAIFGYHWMVNFRWSVVEDLRNFWYAGNASEIGFYAIVLVFLSFTYGGARLGYQKNAEIVFSQILSTLLANIIIYFELSIMAHQPFVLYVFVVMMAEQFVIVLVYLNLANRLYRSIFPPRRLLLIYGERPVEALREKFESRRDKYIITRMINVNKGYKAVCSEIDESYNSGECNAVVLGDISVDTRLYNAKNYGCYSDGRGGTSRV